MKAQEKFLMSEKDLVRRLSVSALGAFVVEYVRLLSDTALSNLSAEAMPIAACLFVALSANFISLSDELWDIVSLSRISKIDI